MGLAVGSSQSHPLYNCHRTVLAASVGRHCPRPLHIRSREPPPHLSHKGARGQASLQTSRVSSDQELGRSGFAMTPPPSISAGVTT